MLEICLKNVLATEGGEHFLKKASKFWKKKVQRERPADMERQVAHETHTQERL